MKKLFVNEVKPKIIFDCLFETKFRPLISFENKEEMNNEIYRILNDESLEEINNTPKVDKIFINYKEKVEELKEEIHKKLKISKFDKKIIQSSLFKEFFERIDKALENGKIGLSFLYGLNDNEY